VNLARVVIPCAAVLVIGFVLLIVLLVRSTKRGREPGQGVRASANWMVDPTGRHELRFWDGSTWTAHVSDAGQQSEDPL